MNIPVAALPATAERIARPISMNVLLSRASSGQLVLTLSMNFPALAWPDILVQHAALHLNAVLLKYCTLTRLWLESLLVQQDRECQSLAMLVIRAAVMLCVSGVGYLAQLHA